MPKKNKKPAPAGPQVKCPACGRQQPDRGPTALYYCGKCGGQFDNEPEEGGDYSNFNPAARLERQERKAAQPQRNHGRANSN